jgi:O-methyltransferase
VARIFGVPATKEIVRRVIDRALRPANARVLTEHEEQRMRARYMRVVESLHDVYVERFVPPLRAREGRLALLADLIGTEIGEAMFLLKWLEEATHSGDGDVVEMGVAQGATSALLANEIRDSARHLWLYDSFQGLSAPTAEDELIDDIERRGSMKSYESAMAFPERLVRTRLSAVGFPPDRTHVLAGFISPDMPRADLPDVVAFAYLDLDLYEPILTGLRLLTRRTRSGSVLMVDDYGYFSSGPERAVQKFLGEDSRFDLTVGPESAGHFCALRQR